MLLFSMLSFFKSVRSKIEILNPTFSRSNFRWCFFQAERFEFYFSWFDNWKFLMQHLMVCLNDDLCSSFVDSLSRKTLPGREIEALYHRIEIQKTVCLYFDSFKMKFSIILIRSTQISLSVNKSFQVFVR